MPLRRQEIKLNKALYHAILVITQGTYTDKLKTEVMQEWKREKHYMKNSCSNGAFLGAAGIGVVPTVACSGSSTAAAPINGIVGAAGNTSRHYKCVDL